ncbi:MAG: DUF3800 domain-containing protein [Fimbriimonadales bacterium]|nr:MAG: hypothetical protein KatS3mg018_0224 [Fimbriimonadales bacterium]
MYLFYLDESGEREYTSLSQYFVLCALGVPVEQWRALNLDVLNLKRTYFNRVDVEIKSSWLRRPQDRQKRYLSQYSVSETDLEEFTEKLYTVLLSYDIVLIASVVDKHQARIMSQSPPSPSALAYRLLFERVDSFLKQQGNAYGVLIFDKISEGQFRKKGYENLLAQQHQQYLERGTELVQVNQIAEGLLFIPSHENNMIQLADLCAYNIYRQFCDYGDEWQHGFQSKYLYFERIESKLYRGSAGDYRGWGIQKFP